MSKLKDFWDSIPDTDNEGIDVDAALDSINSTITGRRRLMGLAAALVVPVAAFVAFLAFPPVPEPEPEILQCSAPLGEHRTINLSDGTLVTLNSGSMLAYSSLYEKGERRVVLSGEAKFEVAKNPDQPFVVKTRDFDVRVLGTVFAVSSYGNRTASSVVLESGSVSIVRDGTESRLYPGQKAEFLSNGDMVISNVSAMDYMSWVQGGFVHKQATIDDIIDYIHNTYGLEVRCNYAAKYRNAVITCRSDSGLEIEKYLTLLSELIPGMQYRISDNILTLN